MSVGRCCMVEHHRCRCSHPPAAPSFSLVAAAVSGDAEGESGGEGADAAPLLCGDAGVVERSMRGRCRLDGGAAAQHSHQYTGQRQPSVPAHGPRQSRTSHPLCSGAPAVTIGVAARVELLERVHRLRGSHSSDAGIGGACTFHSALIPCLSRVPLLPFPVLLPFCCVAWLLRGSVAGVDGEDGAASPEALVGASEHHSADAQQPQRRSAHDARLHRHIQRTGSEHTHICTQRTHTPMVASAHSTAAHW